VKKPSKRVEPVFQRHRLRIVQKTFFLSTYAQEISCGEQRTLPPWRSAAWSPSSRTGSWRQSERALDEAFRAYGSDAPRIRFPKPAKTPETASQASAGKENASPQGEKQRKNRAAASFLSCGGEDVAFMQIFLDFIRKKPHTCRLRT
jgi:hypothetical protein